MKSQTPIHKHNYAHKQQNQSNFRDILFVSKNSDLFSIALSPSRSHDENGTDRNEQSREEQREEREREGDSKQESKSKSQDRRIKSKQMRYEPTIGYYPRVFAHSQCIHQHTETHAMFREKNITESFSIKTVTVTMMMARIKAMEGESDWRNYGNFSLYLFSSKFLIISILLSVHRSRGDYGFYLNNTLL